MRLGEVRHYGQSLPATQSVAMPQETRSHPSRETNDPPNDNEN